MNKCKRERRMDVDQSLIFDKRVWYLNEDGKLNL